MPTSPRRGVYTSLIWLMSSSGVTTVSGWTSFMCIMAYFFTSSTPCGEIIVQPQGHVPIAATETVCLAAYLSSDGRTPDQSNYKGVNFPTPIG